MSEAKRKRALYIVLGLAVLWGAWNFSHPRQRYLPSTEPVAAATAPAVGSSTARAQVVDIESKQAEAWGRDPFKSGRYSAATTPQGTPAPANGSHEPTKSGWSLTGILYSAAAPMAFINGRMVKVGDTVDRARVVNIDKQKVTLSVNGKAFDLFVNKG